MNSDDHARTASGSERPSPQETGAEALDWAVRQGAAGRVVAQLHAKQRRRRRRRAVAVSGVALLLVVGGLLWRAQSGNAPVAFATPSSVVVSAPMRQVLPDGSTVELRAGARVAVAFDSGVRRVRLEQGEAYFQVAKDARRPFVVAADGVEAHAVGTAFLVQLEPRAVDVLVTEGRVAVDRPGASMPAAASEPAAVVEPGQQVVVDRGPSGMASPLVVVPVSAAEQNDRLAWRIPRFEFSGTPLSEVLEMFNRANERSKLSLDPSLTRLQLSGRLRSDDVESLLLLLKNEFGIEPQPRADGTVFLRRP